MRRPPCMAAWSAIPRTVRTAARRPRPSAAAAARQSDDGAPERYAVPDDDADSRAFALAMAQVADAVKGTDLLLLHVAPIVYWTRYMLFVTVFSRPQVCGPRGEA